MSIVLLVILSQMLWQALQIGSDFWLSRWSNDSTSSQRGIREAPTTAYRLEVYSVLGLLAAGAVFARTVMITVFGMRASQRLFDRMTAALLNAPMRFFDATPIGRLLTRYGGDTFSVDVMIPGTFGILLGNVFSVGCSAITAALIIRWKGLLLLPVVFIYMAIAEFYLTPARELERLSKTTQAPVLNHLSESVDGGSVVRAFGPQHIARFYRINNSKLDENSKAWYTKLCVSQWFSLRVQLLGSLLLLIVTSSLVLLHNVLDAAIIGLAFSYSLKVSASLEDIVRVLTRVETLMVSPERMQEYIDIEQEAPAHLLSSDPSAKSGWPSTGTVTFNNVDFRYKPRAPLVLYGVSFSVSGRDKIGIVGRTGAGKSSLTMALFRINELAGGAIIIDGVDISKLGLTTLREKLSIIPQVPVLFKGSLRSYLDPFEEFTDDQLWRSLEQVGLRERVASDELKLLLLVEENGENFSVGERQMLCMARALLRSSRIVVFDEATAAIDHETDQKLQRVIRSAFRESTVLTIAHRLDTILDSDRVLVLDGGRVAEFAPPKELVARGEGHFFDLMREGGLLEGNEMGQ
jgi:ABC-type multidrug transport system fused ATPase/permease subunit